ncbi:MAG TPA: hypothetical protein VHX87_11815 [Galbitalea sp.]|nr:hypothetical protein [Galbitalea sp.]
MIAKVSVGLGVVVLVTIALVGLGTRGLPLPASVAAVFAGSRGTVGQYLFGMAALLVPAFGFSIAFSLDWHRRAPLLVVRYGKLSKWYLTVLRGQLLIAVAYGLGLLLVTIAIRIALGPVPESRVFTTLALIAVVAVKLVLAEILFIAVAMATIVVVHADGIWVLVLVLLVGAGFLPAARSSLFPITAWSAEWDGADTWPSIASLFCAVLVVLAVMFIASQIRKEAGYINGRRRAVGS